MLRRVTVSGVWLLFLALACALVALGLAALLGRAGERRRGDAFVPSAFEQGYREPGWRYASPSPRPSPSAARTLPVPDAIAAKIVAGARAQQGTVYTVGYFPIGYPNGDLPKDQGVCTDVVVRALRAAGHDLQLLLHEDMRAHFGAYPKKWGLRRPDRNIDHRRVPNQRRFFERKGVVLPAAFNDRTRATWRPGDIVTWQLPSGLDHTGVVTDRVNDTGVPLVVHNIGTCTEEDCLLTWRITGHYRYPKR